MRTMDQEQRARLAQQITEARSTRALSQRDLATLAGVAQNTIVSLEAGRPTRPGSVRKVLDALGVEPISEQVERGLDPTDVHMSLDIVRMWLLGMPEAQREQAATELVRFMMGWKPTGK